MNIQKPVAIIYTIRNELSEREIKKTVPFIMYQKEYFLGINLTQEVKDLYTENYKTLMKKTI